MFGRHVNVLPRTWIFVTHMRRVREIHTYTWMSPTVAGNMECHHTHTHTHTHKYKVTCPYTNAHSC